MLGAGGAGKSRLAREMAEILNLPVIHLDKHYWNPGWVESERDDWARKVVELASADQWIGGGGGPRCCDKSRLNPT